MTDNVRYQGKPMLRLLECFVLESIGCLSDGDRTNLTAMESKLSATFNADGAWNEIISETMNWPKQMPTLIADAYSKNQKFAADQGMTLDSQTFAEMFVDQNFV